MKAVWAQVQRFDKQQKTAGFGGMRAAGGVSRPGFEMAPPERVSVASISSTPFR